MKKVYLLIVLSMMALAGKAQDVIVTKKSGRIDAQIIEISDNGVRYRLWTENNGVTHALSADEVASILFANGEVYVFPPKNTPQPDENAPEVIEEEEKLAEWTDTVYEEFPILLSTGKEIMYRSSTLIEIRNNETYYGDVRLKREENLELLKYCPEAYNIYSKAKISHVWGNIFGSLGAVTLCYSMYGGIFVMINDSPTSVLMKKCLIPLGGAILLYTPAIRLAMKEVSIIKQANDIFNHSCAWRTEKPQPELSLHTSLNGLGLTFSF